MGLILCASVSFEFVDKAVSDAGLTHYFYEEQYFDENTHCLFKKTQIHKLANVCSGYLNQVPNLTLLLQLEFFH